MVQHFLIVGVFYIVLIGLNLADKMSLTWWAIALQCSGLLIIDYTAHRQNHGWAWLKVPWQSVCWIIVVTVSAVVGLLEDGWQVAVILGAQACWDNSWHSVEHHRPEHQPTTHTDRIWIRWGSVAAAAMAVILPLILVSER